MTSIQERYMSLLQELSELLTGKDVPFCAAEWLAWHACLSSSLNQQITEVAIMVPADAMPSIKSLAVPDRRLIVQAVPGFYDHETLRYVDCDTFLVDPASNDQAAPGVSVRMVPVFKEADGWRVDVWDTGSVLLRSDPLSDRKNALIEDVRIPVPYDFEEYFSTLLGDAWRNKYSRPVPVFTYGIIYDPDCPYEAFLTKAQQLGIYDPSFPGADARGRWPYKRAFSVSDLAVEDVDDYVRLYGDKLTDHERDVEDMIQRHRLLAHRFKLCERYLPHKEMLLEQWESGDKALVEKSMGAYLKLLLQFYDKGLVLHFDNKLFDLALEILRGQGWEHVDELEGMVPQRYRDEELSNIATPYLQ